MKYMGSWFFAFKTYILIGNVAIKEVKMFTLMCGSIARIMIHRPFTVSELVNLFCCFGGEIGGGVFAYEIGKAVGERNAKAEK